MANKKTPARKSSKKNNGVLFTAACVVLGLLVIFIIFMVKKDQIFSNLKETAFFDKVFGTTPQVIEKSEIIPPKENETIPLKNDEITINIQPEVEAQPEVEEPAPVVTQKDTEKTEEKQSETSVKESPKSAKEEKKNEPSTASSSNTPATAKPATTDLQLCFVYIDGDGSVVRKVVKRSVTKNDSPLTNAINLLMQGPDTTKSAEKNLMTVITKGTKLLSAKVSNGVAYLNFNDTLEFNEYGVEGKLHSLEQIVFTASSFSTVSSVQILIDGKQKDYLGEEGVFIGAPLTKNNF